jgi:hypothetical protein
MERRREDMMPTDRAEKQLQFLKQVGLPGRIRDGVNRLQNTANVKADRIKDTIEKDTRHKG